MERSASGEHAVCDPPGRNSLRMDLAWDSAVGSTGSLISNWTCSGVRRMSMLGEEVNALVMETE